MSSGGEKYRVARWFALNKSKHGKSIVFLYALNAGWPYYIKTKDLTNEHKAYRVEWFKDRHHEIMLLNGMYPNYFLEFLKLLSMETQDLLLIHGYLRYYRKMKNLIIQLV